MRSYHQPPQAAITMPRRRRAPMLTARTETVRPAIFLEPTQPPRKRRMARQIVYRGRKIQVAIDTDVHKSGQSFQRDVVLHPGAVAILPVVDSDNVCLLRNSRPVVGATLWEIPAGTLEPGEAPEDAAPRELAEETGYQASRSRKLTEFYPSPGV